MMNKSKNIVVSLITLTAIGIITGCGGSGGSTITEETPIYKPAGWYGKTKISATAPDGTIYVHKTAGIFGELIDSTEDKDKNDVPGYGTAILQVVFPQTTWGEYNGDYFSNYQPFIEGENLKRVWTFQIKNQKTVDLKNAPIKITLDGVYDVTYFEEDEGIVYQESTSKNSDRTNSLTLIDVDNHISYSSIELKTTDLNMDGHNIRTFRWVKGEVEESDYVPLRSTSLGVEKISDPGIKKVFIGTGFGRPPHSN